MFSEKVVICFRIICSLFLENRNRHTHHIHALKCSRHHCPLPTPHHPHPLSMHHPHLVYNVTFASTSPSTTINHSHPCRSHRLPNIACTQMTCYPHRSGYVDFFTSTLPFLPPFTYNTMRLQAIEPPLQSV